MDETTHPFSKKVLDRANTIEFNYINLDQYPIVDDEDISITNVVNSFFQTEYLQLIEVYKDFHVIVEATTTSLVEINNILEKIHSHVGFRIRDAFCFYLVYNHRYQLLEPDAAFDLQLLQKILPRIQGSQNAVRSVLLELLEITLGKRLAKKELMDDATDLLSKLDTMLKTAKYPQSARKLGFMLRRLDEDGFTSYWLS